MGLRRRAPGPMWWLMGLLAIAPAARAADGAWQGNGTQLILSQRGGSVAGPALRPQNLLPAGAVVTSINWHIESERPLPSGVRLALCLGERCFFPDGLAGRNLALAGQPAGNPATRPAACRYTLNLGPSSACALACPVGSYILLKLRCSLMVDKPR